MEDIPEKHPLQERRLLTRGFLFAPQHSYMI